jgi:hypothetical protein
VGALASDGVAVPTYRFNQMTSAQIQTLRQLHAVRKVAQNAYHACLVSMAPDSERHAAERACSAAVASISAFMEGLQ